MTIRIDPERHEPEALARIGASFDGARVLEIGAGDGRLTRMYTARARSVVALDSDAESIAALRAAVRSPNVEALAHGFDAFDDPRRRFDVVLFSWSL